MGNRIDITTAVPSTRFVVYTDDTSELTHSQGWKDIKFECYQDLNGDGVFRKGGKSWQMGTGFDGVFGDLVGMFTNRKDEVDNAVIKAIAYFTGGGVDVKNEGFLGSLDFDAIKELGVSLAKSLDDIRF